MKRGMKITFILSLVSILCVCNIQAEIIWDSGHHVFSEGSETYVTMLNDASADITGGWIAEFSMLNETTADIIGGGIGALLCYDTSSVDVYDTSTISLIKPFDSSFVNISGGSINDVFAVGSSNTNIYNGDINMLQAENSSIITLYVEGYEFDPQGGFFQCGLLTGNWLESGNPFSIELETEDTINHLNFVPEPTTLFLFGIGGLIVLKKVKNK
jgi:hypothetical protein